MNEMDLKLSKIVMFFNQYKLLEIRKCFSMTLTYINKFALIHKLILESVLKLKKNVICLHYKTF